MKILLIYPGDPVKKPRLPIAVIALATQCKAEGIDCRVVDERLYQLNDEDILSCDIIGLSSMSGEQLKSAIKTAGRIRGLRPDVPLVWGGPHASAYPVQAAKSELVDYVVKAEGERTFIKLCRALTQNGDIESMASITFQKADKTVIDNPVDGNWINMDDLRFPEYSMVDLEKYADHDEGLSYETSRGCPYRCAFCYVDYFHNRKWRGKSVDKVMEELKRIRDETGVKKLYFIDDNFFGSRKRSLEICRRMIEEGLVFKWQATIRANVLAKFTDEEMDIIKGSGCEILAIGAESGSEKVLKEIKKDITPEQIKVSVAKCVDYDIMPQVSFVIGFPFEDEDDLALTIELYNELAALGKNVEINGLFIYLPYVGTPMFKTAQDHGFKPSETMEGWGNWDFSSSNNNPWISRRKRKKLEAISSIARFKYMHHRFEYYSEEYRSEKLSSPLVKLGYNLFVGIFAKLADLRWKHMFFSFAVEWKLWRYLTFRIFKIS